MTAPSPLLPASLDGLRETASSATDLGEKTANDQTQEPGPTPSGSVAPFTMWVAHCPFRRNGSPVLGNLGSTVAGVVVMRTETWDRLCAAIPQLATTAFNVGTFE